MHLQRRSRAEFGLVLRSMEIQKVQPIFLPFFFSFDLTFSVFIGYNIGCKHRVNLENGLESYFNKWSIRNQHYEKVY